MDGVVLERGPRTARAEGVAGRVAQRSAVPLLAAGCGALPVLVFPAPDLGWLGYVVLVPLMLVLRAAPTGRRAARLGWYGGMGFLIGVMNWLGPSMGVFMMGVAALLGLLWAPWGWLVWRLLHGEPGFRRAAAALVLVPCGWLAIETVRSWQYLGGPWGLMGASQWRWRPALVVASVGGVWLVSGLLLAVNTAVVLLVRRRPGPAGYTGGGGLLVAGLAVAVMWFWAPAPRVHGSVTVGVVQPGLQSSDQARSDRAFALTRTLAAAHPDLVVWGESSVNVDLTLHPEVRAQLARLSAAVGSDLLVNVDARRPNGGIYKSSMLISPQGWTGQRYDKIRLVPFGEYIPLRPVLGWVADFSKAAAEDRRTGSTPVLMHSGGLTFGPLICFESAFPDMSRALVDRGAQLLVVQSSTATFEDTWAPEQHASLAALRAAETGRPVAQATLTGVSAAYDPLGRAVGQRLGTSASAATVYRMPLATGSTLYDCWGNWVPMAACLLLLLAAGAEVLRLRRR